MKKPNLLLLDADVIVFAHQFQVWDKLKDAYEVHVPATVIDEVQFYRAGTTRKAIDLESEELAGKIKRLEAVALDIAEAFKDFDDVFFEARYMTVKKKQ